MRSTVYSILQSQSGMNVSRACADVEDSCSGIEIEDLFVDVNQNNSLFCCCELKQKWGLEYYLEVQGNS